MLIDINLVISIFLFLFQRGVAEVEWEKTGLITTCRVGHEGKVKCS